MLTNKRLHLKFTRIRKMFQKKLKRCAREISHTHQYLIHPIFFTNLPKFFQKFYVVVGKSLLPYNFDISTQAWKKYRIFLSLSDEEITSYIVRRPIFTTRIHNTLSYYTFLKSLQNKPVINEISFKNQQSLHNMQTQKSPTKVLVRRYRPAKPITKRLKPYLFTNAFQSPKTFFPKDTVKSFLKIRRLNRFKRRRLMRKKNQVKRTFRFLKRKKTPRNATLTGKFQIRCKPHFQHPQPQTRINALRFRLRRSRRRRRLTKKRRIFLTRWRRRKRRSIYLTKLTSQIYLTYILKISKTRQRKKPKKGKRVKRIAKIQPTLQLKGLKRKPRSLLFVNTVKGCFLLAAVYKWRGVRKIHKRKLLQYTTSSKLFQKPTTVSRFWQSITKLLSKYTKITVNKSFVHSGYSSTTKLKIHTKVNKAFILGNIGVFILNNSKLFKLQNKFKYRFKKLYFSFLVPNQLKKALMDKKKKIIISRFFLRRKLKTFVSIKFSYKTFKKNFKNFYNLRHMNNLEFSGGLSHLHAFQNSSSEIVYKGDYLSKGLDFAAKIQEVFIRRVRFKPGYQRIWRQARTSIKEALSLKFKYQYRLTRHLTKFLRQTTSYILSFSEVSLEKIFMYSRLLPDKNTLDTFISDNLVYINGFSVSDTKSPIAQNDIIQLVVSNWYYILYRWLRNWSITRIKKFKRLVYRKGLAGKHRLMKTRKQRSRYTPNWIHNVRYDMSDVKHYLEVDYFTLSAFMIYEPFILSPQFINDLPQTRPNILRLYNWKYIT